jgi:hypothetical protein
VEANKEVEQPKRLELALIEGGGGGGGGKGGWNPDVHDPQPQVDITHTYFFPFIPNHNPNFFLVPISSFRPNRHQTSSINSIHSINNLKMTINVGINGFGRIGRIV